MIAIKTCMKMWAVAVVVGILGCVANASPAPPVVKTVPWAANNPLVAHPTYSGKTVTLKGTCDQSGADVKWTWDFGDGSPVAVGTVSDRYVIEAKHAYTGPAGTGFTARLTVQNTTTGMTGTQTYFVQIENQTLEVEANVAIDEGLWWLHKSQVRSTSGGLEYGNWYYSTPYGNYANLNAASCTAANVNAFEAKGHLESGLASDPYTETVKRGMNQIFAWLYASGIGLQTMGDPDSNNNDYGVFVNDGYQFYQGGMLMDAIVASGTPLAVAATGPAPSGGNPGIQGRTYRDIVQDMVDAYAWAQWDGSDGGGWRYSSNEYPDNSACQWAAIGMIAAERQWGLMVPQWVKDWNVVWLDASQYSWPGDYYHGAFGYQPGYWFPWGPYATTPSGMVQMCMDGIGRGNVGWPSWDAAETFIRDNFGATGGPVYALREYYYGLFSFVKSMLYHPGGPIVMLHSQTPGVVDVDWYGAETSAGAPMDGVARTLVNGQDANGYWWAHNYTGDQFHFETAWAIMMLNQTVVEGGRPRAIAIAIPNPGIVGQTINLDGSGSYHEDASKNIIKWEWDVDADGDYDVTGVHASTSFTSVGNYPVKLRVTDDGSPQRTAETTLMVLITTPPVAPTAIGGGPYILCPQAQPWYLDGRGSINPDEGQKELGCTTCPTDTIVKYEWDLNGNGVYGDPEDAIGPTPDVTAYFASKGPGFYKVYLRVTDRTSSAYPSSMMDDLSGIGTADVIVLDPSDEQCQCSELSATADAGVTLTWTPKAGADHYNIYRSETAGGPYALLDRDDASPYTDTSGVTGTPYYYVIRPALANDDEMCQSNEVEATPMCSPVVATCVPTQKVSNSARYYRELGMVSDCYGRMQIKLYVGDTGSSLVVGPLKVGDIVRIQRGPTAKVLPGFYGVAARIWVRGDAKVWAVDPTGVVGPAIICPEWPLPQLQLQPQAN